MTYLIKRTVIAALRLEAGSTVTADEIGPPADIERLVALGAIEEVAEDAPSAPDQPSIDDALRAAMISAINELPGDAFDSGGKPRVKALEAALPEMKDRITAAVRDLIWDEMKAVADTAT